MEITFQKTTVCREKPKPEQLVFGKYFTDHMFLMDYDEERGWHDARIVPFAPLPLHPASTVLHYGAEVFEGLKAYLCPDGKVRLFRPYENARRMIDSADRLCLPPVPEELFMEALTALVRCERDWIPSLPGTSLYLRPFLIGNDECLGVHAVHRALFAIIASPVGSYYKEGLNPVKIFIEDRDVRAVRGGTGYAKCGGNYAASNRAGARAEKQGYSQVLWLDGVERRYIEEVGAMNVMFRIGDEIATPALTGSILPGITRSSCIALLGSYGYPVSERRISIDELVTAMKNGTLLEAFGTGTAAVISPIGEFCYRGEKYPVNGGEIGTLSGKLYDTLTGIQWGRIEDPFQWTVTV